MATHASNAASAAASALTTTREEQQEAPEIVQLTGAGIEPPPDTHVGSPSATSRLTGDVPLELLRTLYLGEPILGRTILQRRNSQVIYPGGPLEYPPVKRLNPLNKKRILVSGGAGFVGSHLVDRLMLMGHDVIVVDNYFTGSKSNLSQWLGHPNFELIRHDIVDPLMVEVDQIYHLACPASPVHYQSNPVKTLKTGFFGTYNMLGLAKRCKARFLLSSTSEVYGDPEEHPQKETYWGHVNPFGPRSCYDEGKRVAEALSYSYARQDGVDVRVARIFNTFGPRMNWNDGRVVSNFIIQALKGEDITVYGDGEYTRSFQYIHDLIDGLISLMESDYTQPVNIGNPEELSIKQFALLIVKLVNDYKKEKGDIVGEGKESKIVYLPKVEDDPQRRKPDTTVAWEKLGWKPRWSSLAGLKETVAYFHKTINEH